MGDLKLIAMEPEMADSLKASLAEKSRREGGYYTDYTMQLLKLVLLAAINSPRSADYIAQMPTLSTSTQAYLKIMIEEVLNGKEWQRRRYADAEQIQDFGSHETGNPGRSSLPASDPELVLEEQLARLMAENDNLVREKKEAGRELRELHERLIRLQDNNVGGKICLACF